MSQERFAIVLSSLFVLTVSFASCAADRDREIAALRSELAAREKALKSAQSELRIARMVADHKSALAAEEKARADELQARLDRVADILRADIRENESRIRELTARRDAILAGTLPPSAADRPLESSVTTPQQATGPIVVGADVGPTWNEVMRASDYFNAQSVMENQCKREWPADLEMFNYCMRKQGEALNVLKQGKPFGADQKRWNEARVRCAGEWPTDYSMRVYCEGKVR